MAIDSRMRERWWEELGVGWRKQSKEEGSMREFFAEDSEGWTIERDDEDKDSNDDDDEDGNDDDNDDNYDDDDDGNDSDFRY
ncbi:hypothetical protein ElyMa_004752500 [Elysia marginata]|uniref:Uncharacterized protein n=1 Tax=Elysia marginata TaxID=1093978 RepID=A0AAV4IF13_9GAST|nr:hypothetical protein ElyMa_004752500 [Elysia marginata]